MRDIKSMNLEQVAAQQINANANAGHFNPVGGSTAGERLVDAICDRLKVITKGYHQKFNTVDLERDYKRQLLMALAETGLTTDSDVKPGLGHYRLTDSWVPTPAEFIAACQSSSLAAYPDAEAAFVEYCMNHSNPRHKWSHAVVRMAAIESGQSYDIQRLPKDKSLPIYERAYQVLIRRAIAGEEITAPIPRGLPQEVGVVVSREESCKKMKDLIASL